MSSRSAIVGDTGVILPDDSTPLGLKMLNNSSLRAGIVQELGSDPTRFFYADNTPAKAKRILIGDLRSIFHALRAPGPLTSDIGLWERPKLCDAIRTEVNIEPDGGEELRRADLKAVYRRLVNDP